MNLSASTFFTILVVIGMLALIVSTITEVIKDVAILAKIPTDISIIVLSLTLTMYAYFAYISYSGTAVKWYYVVATIIAGFVVAYVVMYGWDKLAQLYKKFRNIPTLEKPVDPIPVTTSITTTDNIGTSPVKKLISAITGTTLTDTPTANTSPLSTSTTDPSTTDLLTSDAATIDTSIINTSTSDAETSEFSITNTSTSDTT